MRISISRVLLTSLFILFCRGHEFFLNGESRLQNNNNNNNNNSVFLFQSEIKLKNMFVLMLFHFLYFVGKER